MLYISNPSKLHAVFHYRLAITRDTSGPLAVEIPSGGQVEIGHGWTKDEKEYVMQQLHRHGARDAAESHGHLGKFTGLLYRDESPVDADEITMAHEAVVATQEQRSATEATRAAFAFDRNANRSGKGKQRLARVTQVEVHQELAPNQRPTGNEVVFDLSVTPDGSSNVPLPT